jgi:hypothetical protein
MVAVPFASTASENDSGWWLSRAPDLAPTAGHGPDELSALKVLYLDIATPRKNRVT